MYEALGQGKIPTILLHLADKVDWKAVGPESVLAC
jgi:hypothetical protein